jgi:hypothetical protein
MFVKKHIPIIFYFTGTDNSSQVDLTKPKGNHQQFNINEAYKGGRVIHTLSILEESKQVVELSMDIT